MADDRVFEMRFAKVYPLLVAKAERKGRTREETDRVTCWLTGYSREQIDGCLAGDITYGDFFLKAPQPNPARRKITGKVCGIRVEEIGDPLMREIR
ncbi:MAG: DUF2200 family protein [Clostridia bacterium]|nr:DUF2200 family protein [Clostridia bacterium]